MTHFDFVFHFAAVNQTHIGKKTYSIYHKVNVLGTENVIKALNFDKFVFMSSAKIYEMNGVKIDESSPVLPIAEYEKSKLEAEKVCKNNIKKDGLAIYCKDCVKIKTKIYKIRAVVWIRDQGCFNRW